MVCVSMQAAFTHFNPRVGYIGSVQGTVLLVFTYVLDCMLIIDILFSMKRAISTPTGNYTSWVRGPGMEFTYCGFQVACHKKVAKKVHV